MGCLVQVQVVLAADIGCRVLGNHLTSRCHTLQYVEKEQLVAGRKTQGKHPPFQYAGSCLATILHSCIRKPRLCHQFQTRSHWDQHIGITRQLLRSRVWKVEHLVVCLEEKEDQMYYRQVVVGYHWKLADY